MKKLFWLFFTFYSSVLWSQDTVRTYGEGVTPEIQKLFEEQRAFSETNDRLFAEKKFDSVILFSESYLNNGNYQRASKLNILVAQYFKGNIEESKRLLNERLSTTSYMSALDLLSERNYGLRSYFEVEEHKNFIINYVINQYKKEKYSEIENGIEILKFYINDVWIRRNTELDKYKTNDALTDEEFKQKSDIQNAMLLAFYKKSKHIFSPKEVGESISYLQNLLLWYVNDIGERAFYLPLVKEAVKKGFFPVKWEIGFILRTELFENPDTFFEKLPHRIEELKKQYNLANYIFTPN